MAKIFRFVGGVFLIFLPLIVAIAVNYHYSGFTIPADNEGMGGLQLMAVVVIGVYALVGVMAAVIAVLSLITAGVKLIELSSER